MFARDGQRISTVNTVSQERRRAGSVDGQVTEETAGDPGRLSQLLTRLVIAVRGLERIQRKPFQDFDIAPGASGTITVHHRFNGAVRWWVVDWQGSAAPNLRRSNTSTATELVLTTGAAGTGVLRVEAL